MSSGTTSASAPTAAETYDADEDGRNHVFSAPVGVGETKVFIRLEVTAGP